MARCGVWRRLKAAKASALFPRTWTSGGVAEPSPAEDAGRLATSNELLDYIQGPGCATR